MRLLLLWVPRTGQDRTVISISTRTREAVRCCCRVRPGLLAPPACPLPTSPHRDCQSAPRSFPCATPMASAPQPLPDVHLSYGPMLVGVFFNMILYGILVVQMVTYVQTYKKDAIWMKIFMVYLFTVETTNTALDMAMIYEPLILQYGQQPKYFPTLFMAEPLCIVLISMPVQLFFAWRIRQLTKTLWLPLLIALLALTSFAGGIWTTAEIQILRLFAKKPLLHLPALVWFLTSCVADLLITVTLVVSLSRKKTGFAATDSVLDKIIRMTIQTGAATALFSILDVVCFMVLPHYAVNFIWDLALSKLYSNCLLSTLNARVKFNAASYSSTYPPHQHPRGYVISPRGSNKDGSFLTTQQDSTFTPDPLEFGIRMTKVVERVVDPSPPSSDSAV
ncbi:unnamed protein product [Mycena citricolor]|uniref:DUF6534 domain-containing protein n=1 Tax=Mycena citricolor TaxID=2018698 RepID=A0AAD2HAV2_9AGAR|nr:unnamed protein product [Mycena citricolor]